MGEPRLYERYDRSEAIAVFGSEAETRSLCDYQWVIFPHVVIGFAEIGEPPKQSHFTRGGEFCWVADKPYQVSDDQHTKFVPPEVVSRHADRPIKLFVRPHDSGRYSYVGELGPACRFTSGGNGNCGEAYFSLSPALPSEIWTEIGGFRPGDLDHDSIDAALNRLRHPVNVEERFSVLQKLVAYWYGPIRPEDGFSEQELEGLSMPHPLRWYQWAGRRSDIMSGQNFLLAPDQLRIKDGLLEFYAENQYCYQWGTNIGGDDPPVFGRAETSNPWAQEGIVLSEHLILACLFEATMCHSPYGASASWLEQSVLDKIIEHIPPIAINPWRWGGSARFYVKDGAFMYTMPNCEINSKQGYSIWVGAKTEHPLRFLKPYIDKDWEYVAV
jgi:hypothetical protein